MCYYIVLQYLCGDWAWGEFREYCDSAYLNGEPVSYDKPCGVKMVERIEGEMYQYLDEDCPLCKKRTETVGRNNAAMREYVKLKDDPDQQAAAAQAWEERQALQEEIFRILKERATQQCVRNDADAEREEVGTSCAAEEEVHWRLYGEGPGKVKCDLCCRKAMEALRSQCEYDTVEYVDVGVPGDVVSVPMAVRLPDGEDGSDRVAA